MISGKSLRAIRIIRGKTQSELSEATGVSQTAIAEYEGGKRDIRVSTAKKLCRALKISVRYLVDKTEFFD